MKLLRRTRKFLYEGLLAAITVVGVLILCGLIGIDRMRAWWNERMRRGAYRR